MAVERTFCMVKPDGVRRALVGELVRRFEARGFQLKAGKLYVMSEELAGQHYAEHSERPFFGELVTGITSGPVFGMVLEGESAIAVVRSMMGTTNPVDSAPGTIRGDFALELAQNVVHGSDSSESAEREIGLHFGAGDLVA